MDTAALLAQLRTLQAAAPDQRPVPALGLTRQLPLELRKHTTSRTHWRYARRHVAHCVRDWLDGQRVAPGLSPAPRTGDLLRHFRVWCDEQGLRCPRFSPQFMGRLLRLRGLELRRFTIRICGRNTKEKRWCIDSTSAGDWPSG